MIYKAAAYSKVNAFLSVTGKKPNGYHTIETLFWVLKTPSDTLTLDTSASEIEIITDAPIPRDASNLCWKAVQLFDIATHSHNPCKITIEKKIPIAGGMAGGSTDAAAVLRLLNTAREYPLSNTQLRELALQLGADVPLFIDSQSAFATGVGEVLTPMPRFPLGFEVPLVLAVSNFPVSAAWAYQHRQGPFSSRALYDVFVRAIADCNLHALAQGVCNDLEAAVIQKFPLLKMIQTALRTAGCLNATLSGSGPTLFGIAPSTVAATQIAAQLNNVFRGNVQFIATSVLN